MLSNRRHGITRIDHLRENDQLRAGSFRMGSKVPHCAKICRAIAENAGNLGSSNSHSQLSILPQIFVECADFAGLRPAQGNSEHDKDRSDAASNNGNHGAK
jgi:hypothetical protein